MNKLVWGTPLALVLAACGGKVQIDASAGGTGGSGSTASGAGETMEVSCDLSMGSLDISVMPYDGPPPQCPMLGGLSGLWTATGAVALSDPGLLVLDQCSPAANCMPLYTHVLAMSDGLESIIPLGAYVKVSYALDPAWASCNQRILVENVPSWDGVPNPVSASNRIYLVGAVGELTSFDSVPFVVDRKGLGCSTEMGCGGIQPDTYVLLAGGTQIGMGQTRTINAKGRSFAFHNLRSYQTTNCDDYWNWAFWAVEN